MNRYLLILLIAGITTSSFSQTADNVNGQLTIGRVDSLYSEELKEQRTFWVYLPQGAADTTKSFPVLYLLDGDAHFYSVAGMMRQLGEANGNSIVPESIVVAILNTNRTRDLTPSAVSYMPNSGGADQFTAFMEQELMPYIEQKYRSTSYRTLVGHSWGGLFTLHTLLNHSELFDNYISIDPTIRWNGLQFLEKAKNRLNEQGLGGKTLFLGVANRLPEGLSLNTVERDTNRNSEHIRKMLELTEAAQASKGLNFGWKFYPDDNHMGVPLIAAYDGLRFLFPWYRFDEEIIFDQENPMEAKAFIALVKAHFANISDRFGYQVVPDERLVDRLGDASLSVRDMDKAYALFQLNIMNYPHSPYVFEALGDFYRRSGETEKAIEQYKTALQKGETARVKRKLDRLTGR